MVDAGVKSLASLLAEAKEDEIKSKTISFLVGFGAALTSIQLPPEITDQILSEIKFMTLGKMNVDKYGI